MTPTVKWDERDPVSPRNLLLASLLLCLLLRDGFATEKGDVCTNPDGFQGTCIGIRSCPHLLREIQTKPLPQATVDFLRKSQCGYQGREPLVCCVPQGSTTPMPDDVAQHRNLGLLEANTCGQVFDSRIHYGSQVLLALRPWAALLSYTSQSGSQFRCGGSVINERYVLTAAHCVTAFPGNVSLISVRLGEHDLNTSIDCEEDDFCSPAPQDIPVERIIHHPGFVGRPNFQDDIALVRLSSPANFTDEAVMPICLPTKLADRTVNLINRSIEISGWGVSMTGQRSSVMKRSTVRIIPHDQCSTEYRDMVPISETSQICAAHLQHDKDACVGDSGGPLFSMTTSRGQVRYVQHGVFSFGPPGDCQARPGVYTRVGHFMGWILDSIEP